MPTYGPLYPGTIINYDGNIQWTDPGNAGADDELYASCSMSPWSYTSRLYASNFGFNIPDGETLLGLKLEVKTSANIQALQDAAEFFLAGSIQPSSITTDNFFAGEWKTGLTIYSAGSSIVIPEPPTGIVTADVNDPGFGFAIRGENLGPLNVLRVYFMRMTAYTQSQGRILHPNQVIA